MPVSTRFLAVIEIACTQIKDIYKFDCIDACQWTKLNQVLIKGRKNPIVYPLLGTKEVKVKNLRSLIETKFSVVLTGLSSNSTFKMGYSSNQMVLTKLKESSLDRCALHCACRQNCYSFSFVDDATQTICTLYKQSEKSDNESASKLLYLKE